MVCVCYILLTQRKNENFIEGLEYVHMTDTFDGVRPCRCLRTKDNHGYWKVNPATQNGIPFLRSNRGAVRHVARVLYKGIHIPGVAERFNRKFTLATPDGARHTLWRCRTTMQFPVFMNSSYFQWDVFYAGWAIPTNAIVGGYCIGIWMVLSTVLAYGVRYPVYYDAHSRKTYPHYDTQEPKLCLLLGMSTQLLGPARGYCWHMLLAIHVSGHKK